MCNGACCQLRLAALGLAGVLLAACSRTPDRLASGAAVRDSAGVVIVTGEAADRLLDWRFSTLWSVGLDDVDAVDFESLGAHAVAVAPDARVYALDVAGRRVLVFAPDGEHVGTLGRAASGRTPAELAEPVAVAVAPDGTVGVYDRARGAVLRWSRDGESLPAVPVWAEVVGPGLALLDAGAAAFVARIGAGAAPGTRHALVVHTGAGPAATLATMAAPATYRAEFPSCDDGAADVVPLFAQELVWRAAGRRVAVSAAPDYVVDLLDGGRPARSVRRAIEPAPGSAQRAMREAGERAGSGEPGGSCPVPPEEEVRARGFAEVIPVVRALALGPDGQLWVERRAATGPARIDVFDEAGGYLGTLPPASPFPADFLDPLRIVAIERTDDGVPYLAVYEIIR